MNQSSSSTRVRETFKRVRGLTTPQVLDHAITSTISRTIITHGSTQMMVLAMLIFGGETLYYFSLALTISISLRRSIMVLVVNRSSCGWASPARTVHQAEKSG